MHKPQKIKNRISNRNKKKKEPKKGQEETEQINGKAKEFVNLLDGKRV